jgi:hypothetical protein
MVCYKEAYRDDPHFLSGDPQQRKTVTTVWSNPILGRPENMLTGVGFIAGGYHLSHGVYMDGTGAFTVHRPEHWIFEGTNLKRGDTFGGRATVVGYECDGCLFTLRDGLPIPTGEDGTPPQFEILAQGLAHWDDAARALLAGGAFGPQGLVAEQGSATLGVYTRGGRAGTVFTAGTTDWSHGLAEDPVVQRITRNVLNRLSR